ncbi:MAG: glycosyltransferase [Pseudomonadota bacterium]
MHDALPDVSVLIMPARVSTTLPRCVAQALAQSGVVVEVIVIDDDTDDEHWQATRVLAQADARVRVIPSGTHAGSALNRAIGLARGTWVALVDPGDRQAPMRLRRMRALAQAKGADVVLGNQAVVDVMGLPLLGGPWAGGDQPESWTLVHYLRGCQGSHPVSALRPLLRRQFLLDHHIRAISTLHSDAWFHLMVECYVAGASVWFSPRTDCQVTGTDPARPDPDDLRTLIAATAALADRVDPAARALLGKRLRRLANLHAAETSRRALARGRIGVAVSALARHPGALRHLIR